MHACVYLRAWVIAWSAWIRPSPLASRRANPLPPLSSPPPPQVKKLNASKATLMERVTHLEKELDKTRDAMNTQARLLTRLEVRIAVPRPLTSRHPNPPTPTPWTSR